MTWKLGFCSVMWNVEDLGLQGKRFRDSGFRALRFQVSGFRVLGLGLTGALGALAFRAVYFSLSLSLPLPFLHRAENANMQLAVECASQNLKPDALKSVRPRSVGGSRQNFSHPTAPGRWTPLEACCLA